MEHTQHYRWWFQVFYFYPATWRDERMSFLRIFFFSSWVPQNPWKSRKNTFKQRGNFSMIPPWNFKKVQRVTVTDQDPYARLRDAEVGAAAPLLLPISSRSGAWWCGVKSLLGETATEPLLMKAPRNCMGWWMMYSYWTRDFTNTARDKLSLLTHFAKGFQSTNHNLCSGTPLLEVVKFQSVSRSQSESHFFLLGLFVFCAYTSAFLGAWRELFFPTFVSDATRKTFEPIYTEVTPKAESPLSKNVDVNFYEKKIRIQTHTTDGQK